MPPPGRPRALDDVKRREVCALVSAGYNIEAAASYVGVHASTVRREALRNEDFFEQLRQAQFASQKGPLEAMQKAAHTHWRAAAWLLERTGPARFTKRVPKKMDMESVKYVLDHFFEAIAEEIDDEPLREKIRVKINALLNESHLDHWAAEAPLRDPKRALRMLSHFERKGERQPRRYADDEFRRAASATSTAPNPPATPLPPPNPPASAPPAQPPAPALENQNGSAQNSPNFASQPALEVRRIPDHPAFPFVQNQPVLQ